MDFSIYFYVQQKKKQILISQCEALRDGVYFERPIENKGGWGKHFSLIFFYNVRSY